MNKMTELQRLGLDVYNGVSIKFNEATGEDALRNALTEAVGGEFNYKNFREYKSRVFAVIEEALDVAVGTVITDQFDSLAEVRTIGSGDQFAFKIESPELFRVARIASGTNDLRRQKLAGRSFKVDTDWFGVKIYEELEMFIAGRVDWAKMVDKVAQSFAMDMGTRIYEAIAGSYGVLNATYGVTGTYDEDALFDMVQHVEAKSGKIATVWGTKKALRKVSKEAFQSEEMKKSMNAVGRIGSVAGTSLMLLPQAHKLGTDEFQIDDNMLIVIPEGEKIVKVVIEGESIVIETADAGDRTDQQMEYQLQKKFGVGVLQTSTYGIYKLQ